MINIKKNQDLTKFLTMKVGAKARYFAVVKNKEELLETLQFAKNGNIDIFILGGGSNTVVSRGVPYLVIKNEIKGKELIKETKNSVTLEVKSGESWMKLVNYSVDSGYYGIENLASIYGTVGAAPIQNIGAYGVEFKEVFVSLLAINLKTGKERVFTKEDCLLGYRDSIFKNKYKNKYFIYSVKIKLSKKPKFNLSYRALSEKFSDVKKSELTAKDVAKAVTKIRLEKLPNPATLANSGSFFKNPEIKNTLLKKIQKEYPDIPVFPSAKKSMSKVPAAWLIDRVGLKGKRFKNIGMYEKQALIMVNYGSAKGTEVLQMIRRVKKLVKERFDIDLEPEVNII